LTKFAGWACRGTRFECSTRNGWLRPEVDRDAVVDATIQACERDGEEMISVKWKGHFGNQLFEYCFGRIVAEHFNLAMSCPVHFYSGHKRDRHEMFFDSIVVPQQVEGERIDGKPTVLRNGNPDLSELPRGRFHLDGYWQFASRYEVRRQQIREDWLPLKAEWTMKDRIAVHVRLRDFHRHNWTVPPEYFVRAVEELPAGLDILVVSDGKPTNVALVYLMNVFGGRAKLVQQSPQSDFLTLPQSTHVVHNWMSTFAWWAAFLGDPVSITMIRDDRHALGLNRDVIREGARVIDVEY
jgi:hypothetical protein